MRSIGELIKERRLARGWSQGELSYATQRLAADGHGIDPAYISRIERDLVAVPQPGTLAKLGAALGIPLAEFYRAAGRRADDQEVRPAARAAVSESPHVRALLALVSHDEAILAQLEALGADSEQRLRELGLADVISAHLRGLLYMRGQARPRPPEPSPPAWPSEPQPAPRD